MMKRDEFVKRLVDCATNYKTLYVMGCFGAPMTSYGKNRYSKNHAYNKQKSRVNMIYAADDNTFGFDCVCLIKGILWGWNGDKSKIYGGAGYAINGVPDIGADSMIKQCKDATTGNWQNIEAGELVWMSGHVGVYVGNGKVVECTPAFDNKVQITNLGNINKTGNYRIWKKHGHLPYVDYTAEVKPEPVPEVKPVKKSNEEVAKEVINGKWGNGNERKQKLEAAGYDYKVVQTIVNQLCSKKPINNKKSIDEIAREVINGKWGNGAARKQKLEAAGYSYQEVQNRVNQLLK